MTAMLPKSKHSSITLLFTGTACEHGQHVLQCQTPVSAAQTRLATKCIADICLTSGQWGWCSMVYAPRHTLSASHTASTAKPCVQECIADVWWVAAGGAGTVCTSVHHHVQHAPPPFRLSLWHHCGLCLRRCRLPSLLLVSPGHPHAQHHGGCALLPGGANARLDWHG